MSDENINVNEREEVKEEAPVQEETPIEEKPTEVQAEQEPKETAPIKECENPNSYDKEIEAARLDFHKAYKTSRMVSNILMFAVVIVMVGIMFLIMAKENYLKIIGYVLAGLAVAGMIVYYIFNRNRLPNKTKAYIKVLTNAVNREMFSDKDFADISVDADERLKMDDLAGDGIYSGASEVRSRNVVHGTFKGHHFLYSEAALVRPYNRKQQVPPLFVGRYISVPNNMKFDGHFIFVYKNPKEPLDLPNAVEDLKVLEEKEDFVVYGPEGANYHQIINNKTLSQLNRVKVEGHLLNLNVVFWGGHTAVYISYDDTVMSVPVDKPLDKTAFDKSFDDLLICFRAITEE